MAPSDCIPLELPGGCEPIPALATHEDEGGAKGETRREMLRPQLPTPCLGPSQGQTRPGKSQPPGPQLLVTASWVFCQGLVRPATRQTEEDT